MEPAASTATSPPTAATTTTNATTTTAQAAGSDTLPVAGLISQQGTRPAYNPYLDPQENGVVRWILTQSDPDATLECKQRVCLCPKRKKLSFISDVISSHIPVTSKLRGSTFATAVAGLEVLLCFVQFFLFLCVSVVFRSVVSAILNRTLPGFENDLLSRLGIQSGLLGSMVDTSLVLVLTTWRYSAFFHLSMTGLLQR